MLDSIFFTLLFVSERKQIAMIADEKSPTRISHHIFATSRSEMEIIMIKNVLEYLEQSAAKSPDKTAVADEHNALPIRNCWTMRREWVRYCKRKHRCVLQFRFTWKRAVMHWQHLWERQRQAAFTAC